MSTPAWVLLLPCGCVCSWVSAPTAERALEILYGEERRLLPAGSRAVEANQVHLKVVIEELQLVGPDRFECRAPHEPASL